jgi:hypothetical protein
MIGRNQPQIFQRLENFRPLISSQWSIRPHDDAREKPRENSYHLLDLPQRPAGL